MPVRWTVLGYCCRIAQNSLLSFLERSRQISSFICTANLPILTIWWRSVCYILVHDLVASMFTDSVERRPSTRAVNTGWSDGLLGFNGAFTQTWRYLALNRGVDPYGTGEHVPQYLWRGASIVMSPNILKVMSFRMSTQVTANVVCCILMQLLCVVSQKSFSSGTDPLPGWSPWTSLGDFVSQTPTEALPRSPLPQTFYRGSTPEPHWGTSIPRPAVFFYVPPIILWDRRPWP